MTQSNKYGVDVSSQAPEHDLLIETIERHLRGQRPSIPAMLHYDARGSELFEEICEQPEYTITRTETAIMRRYADEIGEAVGPDAAVLEPGSGASTKTEILLGSIERCAAYLPIDISDDMLQRAADRVNQRFPAIPVTGVHADFTEPVAFPPEADRGARRLVYFPGSTIGNFDPAMQASVLRSFREDAGDDGLVLLGADLVKPVYKMEAAYNDLAGVTAEFNLNVIDRLADEFGLGIDRGWFRFQAEWDETKQAIVSYLITEQDREIRLPSGARVELASGDRVLMEESHKYTADRMRRLAEASGLSLERTWTDADSSFGVFLLRPRA